MKHLKFASALVLVACLMLSGCQAEKQESAQDQVSKYESLESVETFTSTVTEHLREVYNNCDVDNPGTIEALAKARSNLNLVCDALINETDVPEKCKEIHEEYKESAEQLKEASGYFAKANVALNYDDYTEYTNKMNKATDCLNEASTKIENAKSLREDLLKSEEGQ